jgi:hypothetical protein
MKRIARAAGWRSLAVAAAITAPLTALTACGGTASASPHTTSLPGAAHADVFTAAVAEPLGE